MIVEESTIKEVEVDKLSDIVKMLTNDNEISFNTIFGRAFARERNGIVILKRDQLEYYFIDCDVFERVISTMAANNDADIFLMQHANVIIDLSDGSLIKSRYEFLQGSYPSPDQVISVMEAENKGELYGNNSIIKRCLSSQQQPLR